MKQQVELELKTIVSKQQFDKLCSFYQSLEFIEQHNYYYVTNDLSHYAFRVRVIGKEKLFTLKNYVDGKVWEYEKTFDGKIEDDNEIMSVLERFSIKPPFTLYGELVTNRATFINEKAELCFDINNYNNITDYEIEYEVKKWHHYKKAFNDILAKADIQYVPSYASKYKRCLKTLKK